MMDKEQIRAWLHNRKNVRTREFFMLLFEPPGGWLNDEEVEQAIDLFCDRYNEIAVQVIPHEGARQ